MKYSRGTRTKQTKRKNPAIWKKKALKQVFEPLQDERKRRGGGGRSKRRLRGKKKTTKRQSWWKELKKKQLTKIVRKRLVFGETGLKTNKTGVSIEH